MLVKILQYLISEAQFSVRGEPENETDYKQNVTWLDDRPQPTWDEVETARPIVQKNIEKQKINDLRRRAYQIESDPLFFEWQRGECTQEVWEAKVTQIKNRYPEPK